MVLDPTIFQKEKNFWQQHKIKIASTLIAIFIWFMVVVGGSYEYKTTIPIAIAEQDQDYIITSPIPSKAHIIVQGPGRYLFSFMLFREGLLELNVNWTPGTQILQPTREDISLSGNAKNLSIRQFLGPDSILVHIERRVSRKIPIRNNVSISPLAGYTIVGDVIAEPESVRVLGPEHAVAKLDSIDTQVAELHDLKFPLHKEFSLTPPANKLISLLDTRVTIAADIQQLLEKIIVQVPIVVKYLPQNIDASIQPPSLSIKVQGGLQVISPQVFGY